MELGGAKCCLFTCVYVYLFVYKCCCCCLHVCVKDLKVDYLGLEFAKLTAKSGAQTNV